MRNPLERTSGCDHVPNAGNPLSVQFSCCKTCLTAVNGIAFLLIMKLRGDNVKSSQQVTQGWLPGIAHGEQVYSSCSRGLPQTHQKPAALRKMPCSCISHIVHAPYSVRVGECGQRGHPQLMTWQHHDRKTNFQATWMYRIRATL